MTTPEIPSILPGMASGGSGGEESATRAKVRQMVSAGFKVSEIARACGISTQAVYKHIRKLQKAGELPTVEASA